MLLKLTSRVLILFLVYSGSLMAQTVADQMEVVDPYVRAVPPGQPNSASFLGLKNNDAADHALVAAKSSVAEVVELHTHTMVDGMMRMRPVPKIDIPAGGEVKLQPGGLHVMLIGLTGELRPDEEVNLTLVFDDGSEKEIVAPIRKLQMHMKMHQHHQH